MALGHRQVKWIVGFLDETWWSLAEQPLRLIEQAVASDDPDPKSLACYG
jgi:hypothetical protein